MDNIKGNQISMIERRFEINMARKSDTLNDLSQVPIEGDYLRSAGTCET
jgi:hypothetical protein